MSYSIAITGKGGTGKTTIAALIVAALTRSGRRPVLAVDADPNACLDAALGVKVQNTVGRVREDARMLSSQHPDVSKRELLELKISESLVEGEDFDLIAMGRPEGPGCYCYANNVLREVLKEISENYPYVVIDNEAGLENLSRRIVRRVDALLVVGEPSRNGIATLRRIQALAEEMNIEYGKLIVVINRIYEMKDAFYSLMKEIGADEIILLPHDDEIRIWNEEGRSFFSIPENNAVYRKIHDAIVMPMA